MLSPVYQYSEPWLKQILSSRCSKREKTAIEKKRKMDNLRVSKGLSEERYYKWEVGHSKDVEEEANMDREESRVIRKERTFIFSVRSGETSGFQDNSKEEFEKIIKVKTFFKNKVEKNVSKKDALSRESNNESWTEIIALITFEEGSAINTLSKIRENDGSTKGCGFHLYNLGGLRLHCLLENNNDEQNAIVTPSGVVRCSRRIEEGEKVIIDEKVNPDHPLNILDCLILGENYKGSVERSCVGRVTSFDVSEKNEPMFKVIYSDHRTEFLNKSVIMDRIIYAEIV